MDDNQTIRGDLSRKIVECRDRFRHILKTIEVILFDAQNGRHVGK